MTIGNALNNYANKVTISQDLTNASFSPVFVSSGSGILGIKTGDQFFCNPFDGTWGTRYLALNSNDPAFYAKIFLNEILTGNRELRFSIHDAAASLDINGTCFISQDYRSTASVQFANVTANLTGDVTGNVSGNAATATKLATGRAINGVSFDGSAAITVPASTATGTTTNANFYLGWYAANSSSNQTTQLSSGLAFNPSTNTLATTTFSGALSGNATTASSAAILTTSRDINGVSFNGSAAITVPSSITGGVSTNASFYIPFVANNTTSNQSENTAAGLSFNPSTNVLSVSGDFITTASTTWSPSVGDLNNLTGTPSVTENTYKKVGKTVFCKCKITGLSVTSTSTSTYFSVALPVNQSSNTDIPYASNCFYYLTSGSYNIQASVIDWSGGEANKVAIQCYPAVSGSVNYIYVGIIYQSA